MKKFITTLFALILLAAPVRACDPNLAGFQFGYSVNPFVYNPGFVQYNAGFVPFNAGFYGIPFNTGFYGAPAVNYNAFNAGFYRASFSNFGGVSVRVGGVSVRVR